MMHQIDIAPSALTSLIHTRRTIHDFSAELVPQDLIIQAIECARWAPNHKLTEPWRFRLLGETTKSQVVELNTQLVRDNKGEEAAQLKQARWSAVPGWLAVSSLLSTDTIREQENYASVCCAIQNLSLILWNQGVGMKWTTGPVTRHPHFYELLQIDPALEQVVGLLWFGYPSKVPEMHRGPLDDILTELA